MDYAALKIKVNTAPYDTMTPPEVIVAARVNNVDRDRDVITGSDLVATLENGEWGALDAAAKERIQLFVAAGEIAIRNPEVRKQIATIFTGATITKARLVALQKEKITPMEDWGLGDFREGDVITARAVT